MVLGYALWNREGIDEVLKQAQNAQEQGEAGRAVRLLNLAQRSLGPSGSNAKREKLLRLRYKAHWSVGNLGKALGDLETLRKDLKIQETALLIDRVRILLQRGEAVKARSVSQKALQSWPENGILRDLSGRAIQTLYQKLLKNFLSKDLPKTLPQKTRQQAIPHLIQVLYRQDGDPVGQKHRTALAKIFSNSILDPISRQRLWNRIETIKGFIRKANDQYRLALRTDDKVPGALQGFTRSLLRAGKSDEAALLSLLYLRRFQGFGRVIPALTFLKAALEQNTPAFARLLQKEWKEGFDPETLSKEIYVGRRWGELWFRFGLALDQEGNYQDLQHWIDKLFSIRQATDYRFQAWVDYLTGILRFHQENWEEVETSFSSFCSKEEFWPIPPEGKDFFLEAIHFRLKACPKKDALRRESILDEWVRVRPEDPSPLLQRANLFFETKRLLFAARDASQTLSMEDQGGSRDRALQLLLAIKDAEFQNSGQDSGRILERLLKEQRTLPDDLPHFLLHYGIAARAIALNLPQIAEPNIRRILQRYPWSTTARFILAQSFLAQGQAKQVLLETATILADAPGHLGALLLRKKALEALAGPQTELEKTRIALIRKHPETQESALLLGEGFLAQKEYSNALLLAEQSKAAQAAPSAFEWIHSQALLGLGRHQEALKSLRKIKGPKRPLALSLGIEAAIKGRLRDKIPKLVQELLLSHPSGTILVNTAKTLALAHEIAPALNLCKTLFEEKGEKGSYEKARNGKTLILLAKLYFKRDQQQEGRDALERAFSFPDGDAAGPLLAIHFLLEGKTPEAKRVLRILGAWKGNPLHLCWLAWKLGKTKEAKNFFNKAKSQSKIPGAWLPIVLEQCFKLSLLSPQERKKAQIPLPLPAFQKVLREQAPTIFEALALAPGLAFEDFGKAEILSLIPESLNKKDPMFLQETYGLLLSFHQVLTDRKEKAAGTLFHIVLGNPGLFFTPAYDELFSLLEEKASDLLIQPDMLIRYFLLMSKLGVFPKSRIPVIFAEGQAKLALSLGFPNQARTWLGVASLLAPLDPAPLRLLAEGSLRQGKKTEALRLFLSSLSREKDLTRKRSTQSRAYEIATKILKEGKRPQEVERLIQKAKTWNQGKKLPPVPPPAEGILLLAEANFQESGKEASQKILLDWLHPFENGDWPTLPHVKECAKVIEDLGKRGPLPRNIVQKFLQKVPSSIDFWCLDANLSERAGYPQEGLEGLKSLSLNIPNFRIEREIARLRAFYALDKIADRKQSQKDLIRMLEKTQSLLGSLDYRIGKFEEAWKRLSPLPSSVPIQVRRIRVFAGLAAGQPEAYPNLEKDLNELANQTKNNLLGDLAFQTHMLASQPPSSPR
jgi:hypothetical protein